MADYSDALVWQLIRKNHSYLVKRGHTKRSGSAVFSSESGNLLNLHNSQQSGLANAKTIDLVADETTIVFSVKNEDSATKVSKSTKAAHLSTRQFAKNMDRLESSVNSSHRRDLRKAALARYTAVYKDARIQRGVRKAASLKPKRK